MGLEKVGNKIRREKPFFRRKKEASLFERSEFRGWRRKEEDILSKLFSNPRLFLLLFFGNGKKVKVSTDTPILTFILFVELLCDSNRPVYFFLLCDRFIKLVWRLFFR